MILHQSDTSSGEGPLAERCRAPAGRVRAMGLGGAVHPEGLVLVGEDGAMPIHDVGAAVIAM